MLRRLVPSRRVLIASTAVLTATTVTYALLPPSRPIYLDDQNVDVTRRRPGALWSAPSRADQLKHLKSSGRTLNPPAGQDSQASTPLGSRSAPANAVEQSGKGGDDEEDIFDLLVIGGGATGAGVALDAASRGLKIAMVEREDFSSGTSSKSTKLVHGGVRYLQKAIMELDYEQWKLVREALRERKIFLETAPHLSHMLPILLPIYTWWQLPYYYAGSKLYDILAGKENMESAYWMGKGKTVEAFPMLKQEGLVGGVVYYDGQHNDSRMNIALVMTAVQHGAVVANHVAVTALHKKPSAAFGGEQRICGATLKDVLTGETWDVKCKGVINATGPFSDGVRKLDDQTVKEIVSPSSGVHITLPNYYGPKTMGLLDPATSDGRVIFFLPWQGNVIAGTTDTAAPVEQHPIPKEEEIQWILDEVRNYLSPDVKVRRGDVLSAWSGLRPLVKDPAKDDTQGLVRNHMINVSPSGLLTIAGGKWTTYRAMAEETVDRACEEFKLQPTGKSQTDHIKLMGGHAWSKTMFIKLIQQFGLETEVAKHLSETYGDRAWMVAAMSNETGENWPIHGTRLSPLYPYIEAEAKYACRVEYAEKATDFIARRTRLSFLNVQVALEVLPRVVDLMGAELGWDAVRKEREFDEAVLFLESMGLPEPLRGIKMADVRKKPSSKISGKGQSALEDSSYSRAQFTPEEVRGLKDSFANLDYDQDGKITEPDILKAMQGMGFTEANSEQASNILREVDFNRDGAIEFHDFLEIAAGMKELKLDSAFTYLAGIDDDNTSRRGGQTKAAIGSHAYDQSGRRSNEKVIPVERSGGGT